MTAGPETPFIGQTLFRTFGERCLLDVAPGGFVNGRYVRAFALTDAGGLLEAELLEAEGEEP